MASFTKVRSTLRLHLPKAYWLFIGVWLAGLIAGTLLAASSSTHYFLLMRMAPMSHVSIVGLTVTVLLPFLCSAFAVCGGVGFVVIDNTKLAIVYHFEITFYINGFA